MADQTTTIPRGWKMTTLGEMVDVQPGFAFKSDDFQTKTGFPVVKIKNIQPPIVNVERNDLVDIGNYTKEKLVKFEVRNGEYLIAMTGETIGKVGKYNLGSFAYINQRVCKIVKTEKSDYGFVYYSLLQRGFQKFIDTHSFGAAQANISTDQIGKFKILIPELPEQRAIAAVLSSFDDKIELLREQNKTLEATAQAIFKEWFVNFNFPGATCKMIDSELGEIPEGWRVEKITNILDFVKGSEPGAANYSNEKVNNDYLPFYRVQDISQYGNIPNIYVEEKLLRGKIFSHDDILVSLDGTIGRVFIGGAGGHSGGIRRVVGRHDFIKKSLILCFLKSPKFQSDLESFSGAETTIKHASGAIEHIRFVLQDDICKKFGAAFDPLFQKIVSNISQIQILSSLRDSLLPKLMKGDVRVKGLK